ncbi:hypothetical protein BGZ98_002824 [Dissophora globulifera]|nr:hypothetical protein BGZ98_002824 [Dissophora globulifera]
MASSRDRDGDKDLLDLSDNADELLDYGDEFDLEADLLEGADLGNVENYDEFDLGVDDDLGLAELEEPMDKDKAALNTRNNSSDSKADAALDTASDQNNYATRNKSLTAATAAADSKSSYASSSSSSFMEGAANTQGSDSRNDSYSQQQQSYNQYNSRDGSNYGGYSRGRPPYAGSSSNSPMRGAMGSARGRAQGYMGGRGGGGFQGRPPGLGNPQMMGMNMGMGGMGPSANMGMNMNMNMQMMNMNMGMGMGMNGPRFPGDGYGNQGMMYPYGNGHGMDGGLINPGGTGVMGMRPPGMGGGGTGRTIHINPKFQNRTGTTPIPGSSPAALSQLPQQPRSQVQDGGRPQPSRSWDSSSARSGSRERDDRYSGRDDTRVNYDRVGNGGSGSDRGDRYSGDSYRPSSRSDRDSLDRRLSDTSRSTSNDLSRGYSGTVARERSRSPAGGRASPISTASRLKRQGDELDDSSKALKSSGGSTPRREQVRLAEKESGSVSFLREKRDSTDTRGKDGDGGGDNGGADAVAQGFVKMENVPETLSDASIRKLADDISGVDRVLTIAKNGDRSLTLGFASVEEAKFFRRQINRTTIEGSLVTVTLASS